MQLRTPYIYLLSRQSCSSFLYWCVNCKSGASLNILVLNTSVIIIFTIFSDGSSQGYKHQYRVEAFNESSLPKILVQHTKRDLSWFLLLHAWSQCLLTYEILVQKSFKMMFVEHFRVLWPHYFGPFSVTWGIAYFPSAQELCCFQVCFW